MTLPKGSSSLKIDGVKGRESFSDGKKSGPVKSLRMKKLHQKSTQAENNFYL